MLLLAAAVIIAAAVVAIARGIDVRLALLLAALSLAALAGDTSVILRTFLLTFSDEKFVVPICTAMGFAYVLKHTGCDQHLVQLLVKPLRRGKLFLIPGVLLVGFTVNIPVISQTSTAVCIGAVVVPLMRAAKLSPLTIGATLLLGASIGGELLNPGAPELNTVAQRLKRSSTEVVPEIVPLIFPHLLLAGAIFWLLCIRAERRAVPESVAVEAEEVPPAFRVNWFRALVPIIPLVLLFITAPPLSLIRVPDSWLVNVPPFEGFAEVIGGGAFYWKKLDSSYATRLIGAAMLVGVLIATLSNPRQIKGVMSHFFEGAGYAFTNVVSLIVVANCFGKAVELVGVAKLFGDLIAEIPGLLLPAAGALPVSFGALSGSGMAATQSLYHFFVEPAQQVGADPMEVGALVSTAAAAGRTMSPVAAVALMSAKLTGTNPFALAKRVAPPLLISLSVIILLRGLKVI